MMLSLILAATLSMHGPLNCHAIDGDTLKCAVVGRPSQKITIRMTGIDAPEMPGHCRASRVCAPGDPFAAKATLQAKVLDSRVYYRSLGKDLYGRTIGLTFARRVNLSCYMLRTDHAIYKPKWDNRKLLAKSCSAAKP